MEVAKCDTKWIEKGSKNEEQISIFVYGTWYRGLALNSVDKEFNVKSPASIDVFDRALFNSFTSITSNNCHKFVHNSVYLNLFWQISLI